jgi:hypothetical protein
MFKCHGKFWRITCCQRRKIIVYWDFVTVPTEILSSVENYESYKRKWKGTDNANSRHKQKAKIGLRLRMFSETNSRKQNSQPIVKFLALHEIITFTTVLKRQPFDPIMSQINPVHNLATLLPSYTIKYQFVPQSSKWALPFGFWIHDFVRIKSHPKHFHNYVVHDYEITMKKGQEHPLGCIYVYWPRWRNLNST